MSRPKDRASAAGLLPRMEARPWASGKKVTYRYHPVGKKPVNLGTDKALALQKVLDMTGKRDTFGTLGWVWEKYQESSRWLKLAEGTREDYTGAWKQIEAVLGAMHIAAIDSPMVARYVHVERARAPRRADVEKSLLSRLFGHGIKLGVCTVNATIGVEPHGSEPNTEAPDAEILATFLKWLNIQTPQRRIVGLAAEYASLTGSRKVEFLDLIWPQVDEEAMVVRTKRAKQRGKKRGEVIELVAITPAMARLLERLKWIRDNRKVPSLYVFPTRGNNAYTASGFKGLWGRIVLEAIKAGVIPAEKRFTFHDLRAYYATVHKQVTGALPDMHKNPEVTARVYDRNKVVKRSAL